MKSKDLKRRKPCQIDLQSGHIVITWKKSAKETPSDLICNYTAEKQRTIQNLIVFIHCLIASKMQSKVKPDFNQITDKTKYSYGVNKEENLKQVRMQPNLICKKQKCQQI